MEYRVLGKTNLEVSILSYGASPLGGFYGDMDEKKQIDSVHYAIRSGINFIDTSPYYGLTQSEIILGKALEVIPRDKFIMGTKVGRYGKDNFNFSYNRTIESVNESLKRMRLDYLDIVQVHDIEFSDLNQVVTETLPALIKLKNQGIIKHIGVTGLPLKSIDLLVDSNISPEIECILSYCHHSLNDNSLTSIIPKLKERNIGVINASFLSMGMLTERGPPDWHPASPAIKQKCLEAAEYCKQHGGNISKLALQYTLLNPDIQTHLVGMPCIENVKENLQTLTEPIDEILLQTVLDILSPIHNQTWPSGKFENN
ncbi:aldo-keto reductase [Tieghemostelium lacteum]|uniref:Aldo-keto reductase n=1 Tax=Tieghemostelium lacteum TaxID=361077 RepID=A0A152A6Q1_TIELA|nr:aldo-keto reductase [Tieghemostelium lacteum]|eukprot:KYR01909.1 aldo-keto reductase [Tieghemostelium lacteum]